jgi:hypothetical protein
MGHGHQSIGRNGPAPARHFRDGTGKSPHAYVKARRLEEARRLLEAGTHAVGDVGLLVGYENFAAFTTALTQTLRRDPILLQEAAARTLVMSGSGLPVLAACGDTPFSVHAAPQCLNRATDGGQRPISWR